MFVFTPWHFLIGRKIGVLLITASHHTSPALVNHWENESQCRNLSLFHILLKDLFPTQTTSIPSIAVSHGQQQVKCVSCGQIHPWVSTSGYLPRCFSQTAPVHLSPLLQSTPLCAALGETCLWAHMPPNLLGFRQWLPPHHPSTMFPHFHRKTNFENHVSCPISLSFRGLSLISWAWGREERGCYFSWWVSPCLLPAHSRRGQAGKGRRSTPISPMQPMNPVLQNSKRGEKPDLSSYPIIRSWCVWT